MQKVTQQIVELEHKKELFEVAGKNLSESLDSLRRQGKQGTQAYRKQKKLFIKTIKALVDIKRFLKRWDKMHLEHV